MLTTDRAVLIRYVRDGKPRRGSGLRVADRYVLTADHCADGTEHMVVTGGGMHPAAVFARSGNADVDVAVLVAPSLPVVEPLGCAVLDRTVPWEVRDCRALGFPVWKASAQGPLLAQVRGNVPTAEGVDPQAEPVAAAPMSLKITDPAIRGHKVPEGELDQAGSPWAGMSGAVVVTADDLVVGVIRGHSPAEGTGSLTATRMEAVVGLPSDVAQLFLTALQISDPWEWPMIPSQAFGRAELEGLRPRTAADRVARMPHDEMVVLLATALNSASAAVLEVFLTRDRGRDRGRAISLLADIHQERAKELIAAIPSAEDWLKQLPEAVEAIAHREDDPGVDLGKNVGRLALAAPSPQGTQGYYKRYRGGLITWSARGGAQVTTGEIGEYHNVRGGSGGRLGFPLSPELDAQQSPFGTDGKFQRFESSFDYGPEACQRLSLDCGGTVYWSKHGAHATWGGIGEYYELNGGTGGPLGFPISDETEVGPSHRDAEPKTTGWCQHFEGGAIYWSEKTKAVAVTRPVADYLDCHHGVASRRGFPVSPDLPAADSPYGTKGRLQRFEGSFDYPRDILDHWSDLEGPGGATIYTSEAHGVYCVGWGNGKLYERLAGTSSWLGFPKSDETDARASKDQPWCCYQHFEGGTIFWKKEYRSVAVPLTTMELLAQQEGLRQRLGFPVTAQRSLASEGDERIQFFEQGIVTVRKGMTEAWLRWENLAQEP